MYLVNFQVRQHVFTIEMNPLEHSSIDKYIGLAACNQLQRYQHHLLSVVRLHTQTTVLNAIQ